MKRIISLALLILVALSVTASAVTCSQEVAAESNLKAQALKLYKVIKNEDWKSMLELTRYSVVARDQLPSDPEEFAAGVRKGIDGGDGAKVVHELFSNMTNIAVGEPTVKGDRAEVPTSATVRLNGKTMSFIGVAHMTRDGQVWKWDLTFTDDIQAATSQELQALIGKPQ